MTTQAVSLTVIGSGANGGRIFSGTATDGSYTAINSTNGNAEIGFAMKGRTVNNISGVYTAGSGVWVLRNRVTNMIDRAGMLAKTGTAGPLGYPCQPITINQNHILQVFTLAAGTTYLGFIGFRGRPPELVNGTIADGASGELVTASDSSSLGSFADQVVESVSAQGPDGKIVSYAQILDGNGGEMWTVLGSERSLLGGCPESSTKNVCQGGMALTVMRGMTINLNVAA